MGNLVKVNNCLMSKPTENQIEQARALLREAGYYTDNLWHVEDIKCRIKGECSDEEAQQLLSDAMDNDATQDQVWLSIDCAIEAIGRKVKIF